MDNKCPVCRAEIGENVVPHHVAQSIDRNIDVRRQESIEEDERYARLFEDVPIMILQNEDGVMMFFIMSSEPPS